MLTEKDYYEWVETIEFFTWLDKKGSRRLKNIVRRQFGMPDIPNPLIRMLKKWWGR